MELVEIKEYIINVLSITGMQLLLILFPIIVMGFLMNISSKIIETRICRFLGIKMYLYLFGWIGTMVHEIGHAIFCILFRHKINEIQFFSLDESSGTLGFVKHSYDPKSIYQNIGNFFIGIGPIILGSGIIYGLTYLLADDISIQLNIREEFSITSYFEQIKDIFQNIFREENLKSYKLYGFIYIIFCVGGAISLSPPDLQGAKKGLITIVIFLFLFNLISLWYGNLINWTFNEYNNIFIAFYAILVLALIINWVIALILALVGLLKK